jgi:hypothetical protein
VQADSVEMRPGWRQIREGPHADEGRRTFGSDWCNDVDGAWIGFKQGEQQWPDEQ